MDKNDFQKLSDWLWEVPQSYREDMRVPARVYATEAMLQDALEDESVKQLVNLATLPGIEKHSIGMPDIHEGYGSPIGGVFAIDAEREGGIISPGAIGYDINCGMRLLASEWAAGDIQLHLDAVAAEIQKQVPSGLGKGRKLKFGIPAMNRILEGGSRHIVEQGYGEPEDVGNCEEGGKMEGADASLVSEKAKRRGADQAGTLGSGNHFTEIQRVSEVFDEETAAAMGLSLDQVVVMVHTGSRGLGHQNATDYIRLMMGAMKKYGIELPDKELASAPFRSEEGQRYFGALACGMNFAWANRQMITHFVRKAWNDVLGENAGRLSMMYDVAHNTAKLETQEGKKLLVHRKGATRAFPPGHPDIPERYRGVGQPVFIPGSMGTASYVLAGVETGAETFYTTCHGSGRRMSRHEAVRRLSAKEIVRKLEQKGILVKSESMRGIAEEAPEAYKDIDEVVEVVHKVGISKKVARLVPLAVIKGE